jgi:hypothetical protein
MPSLFAGKWGGWRNKGISKENRCQKKDRRKSMKKLILLCVAVFLCTPFSVYAISIGDPKTNGQFKFGIGLDQEFLFDRDLDHKSIKPPLAAGQVLVDNKITELSRTMITGSFGIFDFLDIYVKLGAVDYEFESDSFTLGTFDGDIHGESERGFAYGGGLKGAYTFKNGLLIGGDLQYVRQKQDARVTFTAPGGAGVTDTGKVTLEEWHVAPFVGLKIGDFIPYAGVKYSDLKLKARGEIFIQESKLEADDHLGTFIGLTYGGIDKLKLYLEGRFIDETAFSFGLTYRF